MKTNNNMNIDAVITWVNSSDAFWQSKINSYLVEKINWKDKEASTRYNSINEVEVAITSIAKYATFIKNIYIVTDNQVIDNFEILRKKIKLKGVNLEIIDHKIIFRNHLQYLPTFNSCSIITMLYNIPNLSEHFVIFNDDTFLMRKTKAEDFFKNGLPVIRGKWDSFYEDKFFRNWYLKVNSIFKKVEKKKSGYKLAQQESAKLLGFKKYIRRDHTPVSIRKSTLEKYFNENPSFLENNIKYRFRHHSQFIISSLSNHLEIKTQNYILEKNYQLTYFQSYNYFKTLVKLFWFDINKAKIFMCFQSLELANKKSLRYILNWIDKKIKTNFAETIN